VQVRGEADVEGGDGGVAEPVAEAEVDGVVGPFVVEGEGEGPAGEGPEGAVRGGVDVGAWGGWVSER
jgi:hypothetical protein